MASPIRLTGGVARGRGLVEGVGPGVRPAAARVREALFSMVGQDLEGARVLDAFGGTGLLG
ncbi:MAG: RsmD family RNA methyltransferase, partial [Myxococcota bacterium]